ncbi:MAG: Do family serine endopeptidase [Spirochaetales bacterium]
MTKKNMWRTAFFGLAATVAVFAIGLYVGLSGTASNSDEQMTVQTANNPGDTRIPAATPVPDDEEDGFSEVAQSVLPVVVEVSTTQVIEQQEENPFFEFFGQPDNGDQEFERPGLGSGVIVEQDGSDVYIITNNHVVGDASDIRVSTYEGEEFEAEVVGSDPLQDLALISIETEQDMPTASLGESEDVSVGEWALAVGNPLGFESTVTAGIISATGRQPAPGSPVAEYTDYIQTDAAINQGNSGGALVNLEGEIIGINTWIAGGQTGGNVGLGFAIPVDNVAVAVDQFREDGEVTYGWLGVSISDADELGEELTDDLGITDEEGSLIIGAYSDSPAARGGIRPGDFITAIDGEPIENSLELQRAVGQLTPGEEVDFELERDGESMTTAVTIEEREPEEEVGEPEDLWPGFQVAPLTDEIRESGGIPDGVEGTVIANVIPDSPAAEAGLRPGDLIHEVDGNEVDGAGDFYAYAADSRGEIELSIIRGGSEITIGMETL